MAENCCTTSGTEVPQCFTALLSVAEGITGPAETIDMMRMRVTRQLAEGECPVVALIQQEDLTTVGGEI